MTDNRDNDINGSKNRVYKLPLKGTAPLSSPSRGVGICVIGAGFVGTVTAAGFAKFGHRVVCVEKDSKKLSLLNSGHLPFFEKDLEDLVNSGLKSGRLIFDSDLERSVEGREAVFMTVGTPCANGGRADISTLKDIISILSGKMKSGQIFVIKSTVPVGTANSIKQLFSKNGDRENVAVINNPEFLREGSAVHDFFNPHRVVIGGDSQTAIETIADIYKMGVNGPVPFFTTNNETAEMIKYASNVFLATKVGFVNELARLCDKVGVDTQEVARVIGADPRIGAEFLNPGPGWGGSCLPKDLKEFLGLADSLGVSLFISQAVGQANLYQFEHVVLMVKNLLGDLKGKRIGALGLTFKANTSDLRESPAIPILSRIMEAGAEVRAYDPAADDETNDLLPGSQRFSDPYRALEQTDCVIILTEWSEFRQLDWRRIAETVRSRNVVDTRNVLAPESLKKYGFNYIILGEGRGIQYYSRSLAAEITG